MKKIFCISLLVLATSLGTMAQNDAEPLGTIYQKFSFTLFDKVVEFKNEDESKNVILSPLSAQMALSMVQNGAANNTLAEIQQAMGIGGYTNEEVNTYNLQLAELLTYRPPFSYDDYDFCDTEETAREQYEADHPVCEMANGVWSKPNVSLYDSFKEKLTTYYDAEVGQADFGTQEGVDFINGWVSEKTHQLIPSILDKPNSDIAVLLANALYFKGNWSSPFETYNTHTEKFHLPDGNTTDVDMMQKAFYCRCVLTDKFSSATIPYGDGDFSMTIFLPTDTQGFPPLTFDDWWVVMDIKLGPTPVNLHMPKFEIDGNYDLVKVFKSLGMEETFTPAADFSQASSVPLWVDNIFQSGKIKVDEQGTEAAAVTAMVIPPGGEEEFPDASDFVIDRPFYFTIQHRPTNTILFVGRMMEIGKPTLSPDSIDNSNMYLSCPDDNHPHAIDLGLPSGTKWACCNVGSTTPEGYGGYYAWGETEEKSNYDWSTYIHCDGSAGTCHDLGSDIAGTQYDVAHEKWGGSWVVPSTEQQNELRDNCTFERTTVNGVKGEKFTSKTNGGSIFLPGAGIRNLTDIYGTDDSDSQGYYWSSSLYPSDSSLACGMYFSSDGAKWGCDFRYDGLSVRPVISETNSIYLPESSSNKACQAIYNLYGIKVDGDNMNTLPPGIYITNGKKIVIK